MNDLPERLPSRPLRNWFLAWHIHTGDPAEVIARGFDVDAALVNDLIGPDAPSMIDVSDATIVCAAARIAPQTLWTESKLLDTGLKWTVDPTWRELPRGLVKALMAGNM